MKLLISEDDFRVADIHQEFAGKIQGIKSIGKTSNAADTLAFLKQQPVDLLLLDIYLPDQLGSELLETIRKVRPEVMIIVITAATERAIFRKASQYGISDFLIKPITFDRFKQAMNRAMSKRNFLFLDEHIDQKQADEFFAYNPSYTKDDSLPKGIDRITLDKVKQLLNEETKGITADAMSELLGASRTTSRRYLEYLLSINEAEAELEYGVVGRPERLYHRH